jgi:hypothetical protein
VPNATTPQAVLLFGDAPAAPPPAAGAALPRPLLVALRRRFAAAPWTPAALPRPLLVALRRRAYPAARVAALPRPLLVALRRRHLASAPQSPDDFWVAVFAWLGASPAAQGLFPGGIVNATAAAQQPYPYARVTETEGLDGVSADDRTVEMAVSAYALSDSAAKSLADRFAALVLDPASREPLRYGDWEEAGVVRSGRLEITNVGRAPGGLGDVWRCDAALRWFLCRSAV